MSSIRRNIVANILGAFWGAALTIAIVPVQVRILGMEAYGVLGLLASLQVLFSVLDLGLSATITRAIATDSTPDHSKSAALVASAATVYWAIGLTIGGLLLWATGRIATGWLQPTDLPVSTLRLGIGLIVVSVVARWPVALYSGVLAGFQRMELLNALKAASLGLRHVGGLIVLVTTRSLTALLLWFALSAVVETAAFLIAAHRTFPALPRRPQLVLDALRPSWKFSFGMNAVAILSALLTQTDNVLVARLLTLEALGRYALAWNVVTAVSLAQTAVNAAMFPAFAATHSQDDEVLLRQQYERATQLLAVVVSAPVFVAVFFGAPLLRLVAGANAATAAPAMALLAVGALFNAAVSTSYSVVTAAGQPYLPLKINLVGLAFYVPLLYFTIRAYGIEGAASSWIVLNGYYLFTLYPIVQRRLLKQGAIASAWRTLMPFVAAAIAAFGGGRLLLSALGFSGQAAMLAMLVLASSVYLTVSILAADASLFGMLRLAALRHSAAPAAGESR